MILHEHSFAYLRITNISNQISDIYLPEKDSHPFPVQIKDIKIIPAMSVSFSVIHVSRQSSRQDCCSL